MHHSIAVEKVGTRRDNRMAAVKGHDLYARNQQLADGQLVEKYTSLVRRVARHLMGRLPDHVQLEDLMQSGMIGLIEASRKFEADKGASFETYAAIRIRGAMLDEVRRHDWAPRSVHRNGRKIAEAVKHIETRTGRDARDLEVAEELGMSMDEYHACLADTAGTRLFSFDELTNQEDSPYEIPDGHLPSPQGELEENRFQSALADAIEGLPEREKLVLSLYYTEQLNLKEIGAVLSVSESRVSQIHSQAAMRLRGRLSGWKG